MSTKKTEFLTIGRDYGPEEFKEKGSRFISYLFRVKTREEADAIVAELWKKYDDATHVCFAFRLGEGREDYFRYNDDGEPGGTAGRPIYDEIRSKDYFNVLVAVVRYYGGTKLGTGGLVRAYGKGARQVLDVSQPITILVKQDVTVAFPYDFTGDMMHIVNHFSLEIVAQDYSADGASMRLSVPIGILDSVSKMLTEKSFGKFSLEPAAK